MTIAVFFLSLSLISMISEQLRQRSGGSGCSNKYAAKMISDAGAHDTHKLVDKGISGC